MRRVFRVSFLMSSILLVVYEFYALIVIFPSLWQLQRHDCSVQVSKIVDTEASWIQRDRYFDSPVFTP